jgi:hypothetical protein
MRQLIFRTICFSCAISYCAGIWADDAAPVSQATQKSSLTTGLQDTNWATLVSDQRGYQIRLLTDNEKLVVERVVGQYRLIRDGQNAVDIDRAKIVTTAYRSLPSDVRSARFFRVLQTTETFIELQNDEVHARIPVASMSIVLLGPRGSLAVRDPFSRGGDSPVAPTSPPVEGTSSGRNTSGEASHHNDAPDLDSGLIGDVQVEFFPLDNGTAGILPANHEQAKEAKPEHELSLFSLKYSKAESVVDILYQIYQEAGRRIAVDERTNSIIVHDSPENIKKIGQLIEALDTAIEVR